MPILKNSITAGNVALQPMAIQSQRAPLASDNLYEEGQVWINSTTNIAYTLTSFVNGVPTWTETAPGGGGSFSSLTVTPGPTAITGEFRVNGNVNEANVIKLTEAGGASGTITINSTEGTSSSAIDIAAGAGGLALTGFSNITAEATAGPVYISATDNAAPTLTLTAGGGDDSTLIISNTAGTNAGSPISSAAIEINCPNGGIGLQSGLDMYSNAGTSSFIGATTYLVTNSGDYTTITASGVLTLESTDTTGADVIIQSTGIGGGVVINGLTSDGATTIGNTGSGGTVGIFSESQVNIQSAQASASAILLNASNTAGGIEIESGTDGIAITSTGEITLTSSTQIDLTPTTTLTLAPLATVTTIDIGHITPTVNRTTTINGGAVTAAHTDIVSIGDGGVNTSASAEKEVTIATGATLLGTTLVNIGTGTAASGISTVNISTGTGGGTKAVNIGNTDALTTITELGIVDINTGTSTGTTTIGTTAHAGAISLNSAGIITLNSADTTGSDIVIESTGVGGGVVINATGNGATTIGNAAGTGTVLIDGGTAGNVSIGNIQVAATSGPNSTVSVTNNARVGSVTFAGYTQAAGATLVITLTNSFIAATSAILASVTNTGTNDAEMRVNRILPQSGSAVITLTNGGSSALNGNMVLSFWILS